MPRSIAIDDAQELSQSMVDNVRPGVSDRDIPCPRVGGLVLRVRNSGAKSFALLGRFGGSKSPTRKTIGRPPQMTLEQARKIALRWSLKLREDPTFDPTSERKQARDAEVAQQAKGVTFATVANAYIDRKVIGANPDDPNFRCAPLAKHNLHNILIPLFGRIPVAEMTPSLVQDKFEMIEKFGTDRALFKLGAPRPSNEGGKPSVRLLHPKRPAKPSPVQARQLFAWTDRVLRWAAKTGRYNLLASPLSAVSLTEWYGETAPRERVLTDVELGAIWRASGQLQTPYRQLYRLLILTGLRLSEVREATWGEFDLKKKVWTIPAERMKAKKNKGREHRVPLTRHMLAVLGELAQGASSSDFVLSFDGGSTPIGEGSPFKAALDVHVAAELRVPDSAMKNHHFTNHDIRRTVRTRGRKLGIADDVGEAMLAHRRKGILATYDHDDRFDERREAHFLWGNFVLDLSGEKLPPSKTRLRVVA